MKVVYRVWYKNLTKKEQISEREFKKAEGQLLYDILMPIMENNSIEEDLDLSYVEPDILNTIQSFISTLDHNN